MNPRTHEEPRSLDVVLIEDNSADVFLIRRALEQAGLRFSLRVFGNGEEALRFVSGLEKGGEAPDIFLMDWNLPRVHGKEILQAISDGGVLNGTPRVVLTSSESPWDRKQVEELGGVFVSKPRSLSEFMQVGSRIKTILKLC